MYMYMYMESEEQHGAVKALTYYIANPTKTVRPMKNVFVITDLFIKRVLTKDQYLMLS